MSPTSMVVGSTLVQKISEPAPNVPAMESVKTIMGNTPPTEGTSSWLVICLAMSVQLIITIGIKIMHNSTPITVNT